MRHGFTLAVLAWSSVLALEAGAAGKVGSPGSLTNAGLIGAGKSAAYATLGWPGLTAGYQHGLSNTMDVGARVSFAYGCGGTPSLSCTGLELGGDLKLALPVSGLPGPLLLRVQPGLGLYAAPFGITIFSLQLPVEVLMAFQATSQLTWHLGLKLPLALGFGSAFGFNITLLDFPIWAGGGLELAFTPALSLHAQVHLGPFIRTTLNASTQAFFGFGSVLGATYRF